MCKGIKIKTVQFISKTENSVHCHIDITDKRMSLYIMCSVIGRPCFICPSSYELYCIAQEGIVCHKLKKYIECWSILNNFETVYKKTSFWRVKRIFCSAVQTELHNSM